MVSFLGLLLHVLALPFKSQTRLEAEIVFLRHQLNLLRRRLPARPRLTPADRLLERSGRSLKANFGNVTIPLSRLASERAPVAQLRP
jgi:hypothetical protein